ncbi:aminopeptidase P family protein [Roseococcus sp. DSY-14]|uniref:aminopeptidase P family protein n=1 Tax=Roseococcus sp. DSY-14 TaxID=3369650 RepID=UPI00387B53A1
MNDRLAALRDGMAKAGVDGFLVPRSDEHLGEYVPPAGERLRWISGFTGSAGTALVLADRAVLWTDGRYTTQARQQLDPAAWELRHLVDDPPAAWMARHASGLRIGHDPWLHPAPALAKLAEAGVTLVPLHPSPLDAAWTDRPAPPAAPLRAHGVEFAGEAAADKRARLAKELDADAALLADAHSVAWLLNLRGADLAHTPMALAFAILHADATVQLFLHAPERAAAVAAHLGNGVAVAGREALLPALRALAGRRVRVDLDATPAALVEALRDGGAEVVAGEDPVRLPRACKNPAEQQGARDAQRRDAVALARFLHWLAREAPGDGLSEVAAARRLLAFRREVPGFAGESFPAIAGAGGNGAIVHYRATAASDRRIRPDECFLIDSGGQYPEGTTDVTRTVWTGPGPAPAALRARYTAVLRGHVALATARFPEGVAGPHLDAIARRPLWEMGLDYDHGTGHGIGAFLSVHEGPVSISRAAKPVPLRAGMILSDEPGFYLPGHYGIRIENLLLVREAARQPDQARPFLEFETLTLAPYSRALLDPALLAPAERAWVDAYHARVRAEIGPLLDAPARAWLEAEAAPL